MVVGGLIQNEEAFKLALPEIKKKIVEDMEVYTEKNLKIFKMYSYTCWGELWTMILLLESLQS